MMRRVLATLLLGLALATPQAHAELRGKVYMLLNPDAPRQDWRRVPLPGAYVAISWSITIAAPAHAVTTCRYSELARSDEKGDYVVQGPNFITAALATPSFNAVYATGVEVAYFTYERSRPSTKEVTMAMSKVSAAERLSRISYYLDPGCFGEPISDPRGLLIALYRSLLDEAKSLGVESERGRRDVQSIETAIRRASGLDQPGPLRAVVRPSTGAVQSQSPMPEPRP
jgi:hypothetical protein